MTDLLARLRDIRRSGDGWVARCPAHEDRHENLSIHHRENRRLVKCPGWMDQNHSALGIRCATNRREDRDAWQLGGVETIEAAT
jgi:hypothetical protein